MNRDFIYTLPEKIFNDTTLSINDLKIYMIVRSFMDTTGEAYPSNNWIAKRLQIHRTTVIACLNKLCKKKYLVRHETNGRRYLDIFRSPLPEEVVVPTLPPSSAHTTPPSSAHTTQLDQSNIISKKINIYGDSPNTPSKNNLTKFKLEKVTDSNYKKHRLYALFLTFYEIYPNKQMRIDAFKAFVKLNPTEEMAQILIKDVSERKEKHVKWKIKKFIPNPSTYLKKEVWLDDIILDNMSEPKINRQKILEKEDQVVREKRKEMEEARHFRENNKEVMENGLRSLHNILKTQQF